MPVADQDQGGAQDWLHCLPDWARACGCEEGRSIICPVQVHHILDLSISSFWVGLMLSSSAHLLSRIAATALGSRVLHSTHPIGAHSSVPHREFPPRPWPTLSSLLEALWTMAPRQRLCASMMTRCAAAAMHALMLMRRRTQHQMPHGDQQHCSSAEWAH